MKNLMDSLIIFSAEYLIFIILGIAFLYVLKQPRSRQKKLAVFALVTCIFAFIISRIAAQFYYNPRPFVAGQFIPLIPHAENNGFPSDHTLLSSAIAFIILYFNKKTGIFLSVLAIMVGLSRVIVGVHHPIDIVGSIFISAVASCLVYQFIMPAVSRLKIYNNYFN